MLAIAVYHFAEDVWKILDQVRSINPAYKFYLRHYSETGLETVLFCKEKKMKTITIMTPSFNEEESIAECVAQVEEYFSKNLKITR